MLRNVLTCAREGNFAILKTEVETREGRTNKIFRDAQNRVALDRTQAAILDCIFLAAISNMPPKRKATTGAAEGSKSKGKKAQKGPSADAAEAAIPMGRSLASTGKSRIHDEKTRRQGKELTSNSVSSQRKGRGMRQSDR